jgi:hypothetical protein
MAPTFHVPGQVMDGQSGHSAAHLQLPRSGEKEGQNVKEVHGITNFL